MGRYRNDGQDGIWLTPNADPRRLRDAENARRNRAEITKALSHGQIKRRDLMKWGLFSLGGVMAPIGGLNPYVRAEGFYGTFFDGGSGGGGCSQVPTGLPPSPIFGQSPFTQPMPRFDVLPRNAVSTLNPAPTAQANTTQQPVDPNLVGGQTGLTGPIEGRPPGTTWSHQRFTQLPPQVAIEVTTLPCTTNNVYNPQVTSDLNSGINPAAPLTPRFHPNSRCRTRTASGLLTGLFLPS